MIWDLILLKDERKKRGKNSPLLRLQFIFVLFMGGQKLWESCDGNDPPFPRGHVVGDVECLNVGELLRVIHVVDFKRANRLRELWKITM